MFYDLVALPFSVRDREP